MILKTDEKNYVINEKYVNIQELADKMSSYTMVKRYGARFDNCENLEDDPEMDNDWEWLNEQFYNILNKFFYEMH